MRIYRNIVLIFIAIVILFMIFPRPRNCEEIVSNASEFASEIDDSGLIDSLNKLAERYSANYFRIMMFKSGLVASTLDTTSNLIHTFFREDKNQMEWVPLFADNNVGMVIYEYGTIYFSYRRDFTKGKELKLVYSPSDIVLDILSSCEEAEFMKSYNIHIEKNWYLIVR